MRYSTLIYVLALSIAVTACRAPSIKGLSKVVTNPSLELSVDAAREERVEDSGKHARDVFWASLDGICGMAYKGKVTDYNEKKHIGKEVLIDVYYCSDDEIRISVQMGENRSREWNLTSGDECIELRHHHTDDAGAVADTTGYGGYANEHGTPLSQQFPADPNTAKPSSALADHVWTLGFLEDTLTYTLSNGSTGRLFKIVFDLSSPMETGLPPSWRYNVNQVNQTINNNH